MTKPKNPEPNPIEDAIGERAQTPHQPSDPTPAPSIQLTEIPEEPTPASNSPRTLRDAPDQPLTQSEEVTLEELNLKTMEKLQEEYPEEPIVAEKLSQTDLQKVAQDVKKAAMQKGERTTPVSKPALPTVTTTSSQESPPQDSVVEKEFSEKAFQAPIVNTPPQGTEADIIKEKAKNIAKQGKERAVQEIPPKVKELIDLELAVEDKITQMEKSLPGEGYVCGHCGEASSPPDFNHVKRCPKLPVEEKELVALRKYILEDGFVLNTVAFHIVTLCADPMTTPSTTTWDFKDRAEVPAMVLALLNQPGYLEGIWPSLRIVMGSNKGNSAWCSGIATTIAFFDVVRTLPALKELQIEEKS